MHSYTGRAAIPLRCVTPAAAGARFTFVYKNTTDGWKIITHHSSALPEPETPKTTVLPVESAAGRKMLQSGNSTNITSVTVTTADCVDNCPGKTNTNQAVGTKATTVRPMVTRADPRVALNSQLCDSECCVVHCCGVHAPWAPAPLGCVWSLCGRCAVLRRTCAPPLCPLFAPGTPSGH